MDDPPPPLIPFRFSFDESHSRISRDTTQILTKYLKNLVLYSTVPISFETYLEDVYTKLLIREHHDSYLYFLDTQLLVETPDEPSFSIPFTSPLNSTETFGKNVYATKICISIAHVFTAFLKNFSEKSLLHQHAFTPYAVQALLQNQTIFEIPNIEQPLTIEKKPQHWLTINTLQIHHFQYQYFQNRTLNTETKTNSNYLTFPRKSF